MRTFYPGLRPSAAHLVLPVTRRLRGARSTG
jgi:hypothetical protein